MTRKLFNIVVILVLALSTTTASFAKFEDGSRDPVSVTNQDQKKSFVVVMRQDPIIAYQGEIVDFQATKPGKGGKINPNSAHVLKYEKFLEQTHDASLQAAGVDSSQKTNDYAFALNGYSAIMTQEQADAIALQKNVMLVLEDQMRYPDTNSSPTFLGLTDAGGAYAKGYTGKGVVVGIIAPDILKSEFIGEEQAFQAGTITGNGST